jgi:hypothetical protein
MNEIKIYAKKKPVYLSIALNLLFIIGCACYIIFSKDSRNRTLVFFSLVGLILYLGYETYLIVEKKRKQIPTIIISDFALEVTETLKTNTYLWKDILDWKIQKEDNTDYLILLTIEKAKSKIDLSFLDKTPFEIEQLIKEIKKH